MDSIIPLGKKNTLAEYMILMVLTIIPMLDKDLYDSWKSRMELYMLNEITGRMILESVETAAEKIQADCDMKATNIILQGLPADIYSLVNHHRVAKDLWERVQLLMQVFIHNPQLQQQFPPSQYGSIHPTQHYSSIIYHQFNHSSVPPSYPYQSQMNHQTSSVPQITYQSPQVTTQPITESPLVDSGFVVPVFSLGVDLISYLNKAMAFLMVVASLRVIVQQVQGRQGQSYSGTGYKSNTTSYGGNNASGQEKVVKSYNCQGEGHMARQCTQPKRPRNATWYKDKEMLVEAQEAGQIWMKNNSHFL
ncbi:retrovirus-related pol polyprotein from transposon TNT 1-94 [Tanacetum coccineum]